MVDNDPKKTFEDFNWIKINAETFSLPVPLEIGVWWQ
jgi:hypothetical protein